MLVTIVIQKTHQPPVIACNQILGETCCRIPCTQHQDWFSLQLEISVKPFLFPEPIHEAAAAHHQNQQQWIDDKNRAGDHQVLAQHQKQQRNRSRRDHDRQEYSPQIGGAGITPKTAIQIQTPKNDQLQRHDPIYGLLQFRGKAGRQFKIEAQQIGQAPCQSSGNPIVQNSQCCADICPNHREHPFSSLHATASIYRSIKSGTDKPHTTTQANSTGRSRPV